MTPRALRALQRGGCVVRRAGGWSVYRRSDAKGAIIGDIGLSEMETLRARGDLKPVGCHEPPIFVWCGGTDAIGCAVPSTRVLTDTPLERRAAQPLLARVLASVGDEGERSRLRSAFRQYERDYECANSAADMRGMNWRGFAMGTRIDAGDAPSDPRGSINRADACARMQKLGGRLNDEESTFLFGMLIRQLTRHAMARKLGMKEADVERRGYLYLRKVARCYERDLKPVR